MLTFLQFIQTETHKRNQTTLSICFRIQVTDRLRISAVYDLFYRIGIDNDDKYHIMR